jgi:hypothetical protein
LYAKVNVEVSDIFTPHYVHEELKKWFLEGASLPMWGILQLVALLQLLIPKAKSEGSF